MSNPNKAKGTKWESDVRDFLRESGLDVEVLRQRGSVDEGDGVVRSPLGRFVLEAKNHRTISLPEFVRQARAEAELFAETRQLNVPVTGVAVVKARGKSTGDGFVVLSLADFRDLLKWAERLRA